MNNKHKCIYIDDHPMSQGLVVVTKKGQREAKEDKGEQTMVESAPASVGSPERVILVSCMQAEHHSSPPKGPFPVLM